MEIELNDVSGLPEALKPLVTGNKLDLSKLMPVEDLTGLKTALQKERENAQVWSKYGKPADVDARIADLEEKAAKGGKGGEDAQAKLDALKADYDAKIADKDSRFSQLLQRQTVDALKAELAKAGVIAEGLDMLATFAGQRIAFNDDGTVKILTADGKPMIGSGADHGATLSDLAKELAASMPALVKDAGAGGSGKPPQSNGGTPKSTMKAADFSALSPRDRAAAIAGGVAVID